MEKLLIDMDGVISDIYAQFVKYEQEDLGITQTAATLNGKLENEAFRNHDNYVTSKGFFFNAPPILDSIEVVRQLNDKYDLFIVSSAIQFPNSLQEKLDWLATHFPFITWKQIVFCGSKSVVCGNIMIDDHFKNLDSFNGQTILFTQPHNFGKDAKQHTRVETWAEIAKMLL